MNEKFYYLVDKTNNLIFIIDFRKRKVRKTENELISKYKSYYKKKYNIELSLYSLPRRSMKKIIKSYDSVKFISYVKDDNTADGE